MGIEHIFKRKHPLHSECGEVWQRTEAAYSGGCKYVEKALVRHVAEPENEFAERCRRAYYINHPRHIAQLISRFVFSVEASREGADPELLEDFSRSGLRVSEVMLQLCTILNCYGIGWLLIDYPAVSGVVDVETVKAQRIRPFARALPPFAVRDWCEAEGVLEWAVIDEISSDNRDPFAEPNNRIRRRLWTRHEWRLFEADSVGGVVEIAAATHNLGRVPLVKVVEPDGFGMCVNHWFEDVVRISDAILNAESEAQMNIIKQMFGLLVVSEDFARSGGGNGNALSNAISRSSAVWETVEEKGLTRYIAPAGTETAAIRSEIKELKNELYNIVGLAIQSTSKQVQTAESKAWDSHNVEQFLSSRAAIMEQAEAAAWNVFNLWDSSIQVPEIAYNREFSVVDLQTSVAALMDLSSFDAGTQYQRATRKTALALLDKIFRVPPQIYQQIIDEIDQQEVVAAPIPEPRVDILT